MEIITFFAKANEKALTVWYVFCVPFNKRLICVFSI